MSTRKRFRKEGKKNTRKNLSKINEAIKDSKLKDEKWLRKRRSEKKKKKN